MTNKDAAAYFAKLCLVAPDAPAEVPVVNGDTGHTAHERLNSLEELDGVDFETLGIDVSDFPKDQPLIYVKW